MSGLIQLAFSFIETRGLFCNLFFCPAINLPPSSHSRNPFLLHRLFTSSNLNQPHTISLCGFLLSLTRASSPTICASSYSHHLRDNKTASSFLRHDLYYCCCLAPGATLTARRPHSTTVPVLPFCTFRFALRQPFHDLIFIRARYVLSV